MGIALKAECHLSCVCLHSLRDEETFLNLFLTIIVPSGSIWCAQHSKNIFSSMFCFFVPYNPDTRPASYLLGISASGEQSRTAVCDSSFLWSSRQHFDVTFLRLFAFSLSETAICSNIVTSVLWCNKDCHIMNTGALRLKKWIIFYYIWAKVVTNCSSRNN